MRKKVFKIVICFFTIVASFIMGTLYYTYINNKFYISNEGIKLSENRLIWGDPDRIDVTEDEIIETYYPILLLNEYKFFFSKKDSLLISKWKEY